MATSTSIIKRTVTLVLTEDEADYIESFTQNDLFAEQRKESLRDMLIRQAIFEALHKSPLVAPTPAA